MEREMLHDEPVNQRLQVQMKGFQCKNRQTCAFCPNTHVCRREDWMVVPNTHEAIIDKAIFAKVQEHLKRDTR